MGGKLPTQTYQDIADRKVEFEFFRNKLKLKHLQAKAAFGKKYPNVHLENLREHSAKIISAGALTGTLLLSPPGSPRTLPAPQEILEKIKVKTEASNLPQQVLVETLRAALPTKARPLSKGEEKYLEQVFQEIVGVKSKANLEGEHLNTTYGYIGAEQHLKRYPGDTIANHKPYLKEGIAPGLGAWGYFAKSRGDLTPSLEETEKWYAVVQTLYLPDWNTRQPYLRNWYKYRKVLIVNTKNGNAVVASIADAGPAAWTGKHFGGSPEVMEYLGGPRYKKGAVVLFFVDDPENKVSLGPVEYNKINLPALALSQT